MYSSIYYSETFHKVNLIFILQQLSLCWLIVLRIFTPVILMRNMKPLAFKTHQFLKHTNPKIKDIKIKALRLWVNIVLHVVLKQSSNQLWTLPSNQISFSENCEGFHRYNSFTITNETQKTPCPLTNDG